MNLRSYLLLRRVVAIAKVNSRVLLKTVQFKTIHTKYLDPNSALTTVLDTCLILAEFFYAVVKS
jgi:hypothetical protein